jgi:hypothetical protein
LRPCAAELFGFTDIFKDGVDEPNKLFLADFC